MMNYVMHNLLTLEDKGIDPFEKTGEKSRFWRVTKKCIDCGVVIENATCTTLRCRQCATIKNRTYAKSYRNRMARRIE